MIGLGKLSELAQGRCGWRSSQSPALQPTDDDDDAGKEFKVEKVGPTFSRLNPCPSLPSNATDNRNKD